MCCTDCLIVVGLGDMQSFHHLQFTCPHLCALA
jgi:hypothetical protein